MNVSKIEEFPVRELSRALVVDEQSLEVAEPRPVYSTFSWHLIGTNSQPIGLTSSLFQIPLTSSRSPTLAIA